MASQGLVQTSQLLAPSPERVLDLRNRSIQGLVFPETHHSPPVFLEGFIVRLVPRHVAGDLRLPVLGVVPSRYVAVLWAVVPEAPVNEDCHLVSCEHNVRTRFALTTQVDRVVLAKSKAPLMEAGSQKQFWLGVGSPVPAHHR